MAQQRDIWFPESESEYSEENVPAGRCCGRVGMPHFMTDYTTAKRIVIRSPWLQIPNLVASVLIFFYIMGYQLTWNLRFMFRQDPDVAAVGRVQKPIRDWAQCTDEDFDCYMRVLPTLPPYCQGESFGDPVIVNGRNLSQRTVQRCWRNDVHQKLSTSFIIPTMVTFIQQSWAPGSETEDWTTDNITEYYIENIEGFTVRLFHSFLAKQVGLVGRAETMQGFFTGENLDVPLQYIPCMGGCDYVDERIIDDLQACGDNSETRDACFSSPWGDVFSVNTILGAVLGPPESPTGLHLDMPRPDKPGYTYRQAGHAIRVVIEYFNLKDILLKFSRDWDFSELLMPSPAYKVSFRPVLALTKATVSETNVRFAVDASGMPDPNRRILHRTTGVWVSLSDAGEVGAFSGRQFLLSVVTGLALFKLANLAVENVLIKIYMRMGATAHVGMLWEMHKADTSRHCHEFRARLLEHDPQILNRVVENGKVEDKDMLLLRRHHHQREKEEEDSVAVE